ncbi:hypothetical protein RIF29_21915 [Crotalaria pallida]|uniref:Uncharacterized protein n=1 Tax=Crotalaria pallida TaxID=3830 RepID=A0AAN9I7L5_CROPI
MLKENKWMQSNVSFGGTLFMYVCMYVCSLLASSLLVLCLWFGPTPLTQSQPRQPQRHTLPPSFLHHLSIIRR